MSIYVETKIDCAMDEVWERTQNPALHERWDARFTSIRYLPRTSESGPQRFLYATRIGFGVSIAGAGESVGNRTGAGGQRTSSLRFWSEDPRSLIRDGAGYWQYVPVDGRVRFITGYNYRTRFGEAGRVLDRLLFRPLLGWATAWSFDRLRLWIEKEIDPADSMRRSVIHVLCRLSIAFVWLYQGLVPKLIARHADELAMLADAGISTGKIQVAVIIAGLSEVLLGTSVLVCFHRRWPLQLTLLLMAFATVGVAISSPQYLLAAFNPISLNLLFAVVSLIGLLVMKDLPSARRCLRRRPENE
ncbi:MAG: DoxX-like family protein [Planctomycetaceae bacterium]|nr:DoxX-like family protein [Planctomycetaceae bacterium]